ncbi:chitinase 18-18 [Ophiocordyceps camponoti-floridani]|uniref:Chitinase 18-18 n=1 Tax=Ophiocordyceps camponoti-floridani TaxID=2030778 RepID=A0A8H4QCY8_9HYPO|nr:chitinase 18-18 [Ophiocordyceps camponoti-floridani]
MALASSSACGVLNGYWGQTSGPDLRTFCDGGIQYATLGFVNMAPENDRSKSGFPGINFSSHCWAGAFPGSVGDTTQLLSHCESIKNDIPYCQAKGVKIILSIGGEYRKPQGAADSSSDYKVSSNGNGEYFADFLYGAFGPFSESWKGPRPFDAVDKHVAVDGFDFDIEAMFDNEPYIAMINKFRSLDSKLLITGAPQCPTNPQYFQMQGMIQKAAFDALFIQFYNNPVCDTLGNGFNLEEWTRVVARSEKSKDAKLFIGLPASPKAAGSGYIGPAEVGKLIRKYKDTKNFGGISLWDLKDAVDNVLEGKTYLAHVLDALGSGCGPELSSTAAYPSSTAAYSPAVVHSLSPAVYSTATAVYSSSVAPLHCVSDSTGVTETVYPTSRSYQLLPSNTILPASMAKDGDATTTVTRRVFTTKTVSTTTRVHVVTYSAGFTSCRDGELTKETMPLNTPVGAASTSSSSSLAVELSSHTGSPRLAPSPETRTTYASYASPCLANKTVTKVVTRSSTVYSERTTTYRHPSSPSSSLDHLLRPAASSGCRTPASVLNCRNCSSFAASKPPFRPRVVSPPPVTAAASRLMWSLAALAVVAAGQLWAA